MAHAAFAGVMALLVGSPSVPLSMRFGPFVLIVAAILLIVRSDQRRLGMFIDGYRRGRTRRVTSPIGYVGSTIWQKVFARELGA